jgi:hypothetical protein
MKTTLAKHYGRLLKFAAVGLMAIGVHTAQAVIIPVSPVGQWDCVINGPGQSGIIFLNFTEDLDTNSGFPTFEGFFVQAGRLGTTSSSTSGRGTVATGRSGSGSSGSSSSSFINLFGGGFIEGAAGGVAENGTGDDWLADSRGNRGNWFFNSKGQIVGSFFTTLSATTIITNFFDWCTNTSFTVQLTNGSSQNFQFATCFTNGILTTNVAWQAEDGEIGVTNLSLTNANFTLGAVGVTNNISFVGKVVMNKRITLIGTSTFGKFTITGVPLQPVPIVSGLPIDGPFFWTGIVSQDGVKLAEEFNLSDTGIPNVFGMTGQGPSYSYGPTNSFCMISAKKRIGFSVTEAQLNGKPSDLNVSRASVGRFTNTRKKIGAKTVGDSVQDLNLIRFNAFVTPFVP